MGLTDRKKFSGETINDLTWSVVLPIFAAPDAKPIERREREMVSEPVDKTATSLALYHCEDWKGCAGGGVKAIPSAVKADAHPANL